MAFARKRLHGAEAAMVFVVVTTIISSLIGILSRLSSVLAENGIGIFALSTFNTDYILVKEEHFDRALRCLSEVGYEMAE